MKKTAAKPIISYVIIALMILSLVLTRLNLKNLVSFALPESQDFQIGENVTATWQEGCITIHGSGSTYDYSPDNQAPFGDLRNQTFSVNIEEGVTGIGAYLFYDFSNLSGTLVLPGSLLTIGDCAFSGSSFESAPSFKLVFNNFVTHDVAMEVEVVEEYVESNMSENQDEIEPQNLNAPTNEENLFPNGSEGGSQSYNDRSETDKNEENNNLNPLEQKEDSEPDESDDNSKDKNEQSDLSSEDNTEENTEENANSNDNADEENVNSNDNADEENTDSNEDTDEDHEDGDEDSDEENENDDEDPSDDENAFEENDEESNEEEEGIEENNDDSLSGNNQEESLSGNNLQIVYRTVTSQMVGSDIFYTGQVGGYTIADESNTSFAQAMEAIGYARYLGTRTVIMYDCEEVAHEVSLLYTTSGVIVPSLYESGLTLPAKTENLEYIFSHWVSESGAYYLPHTYSNESVFYLYAIMRYASMERQTLKASWNECIQLSAEGDFPVGTSLELINQEIIENGNTVAYQAVPIFMIDGKEYKTESDREIRWTISGEYFTDDYDVKVYHATEEGYDNQESIKLYVSDGRYEMELSQYAKDILRVEITEHEKLPEYVTWNYIFNGVSVSEEKELLNVQIPYDRMTDTDFVFDKDYTWPIKIRIFENGQMIYNEEFLQTDVENLSEETSVEEYMDMMGNQISGEKQPVFVMKEDVMHYLLPDSFATKNLEIHISAAKKNVEATPVMMSGIPVPIFVWLENAKDSTVHVNGVNDLEGFTLLYEMEKGLPRTNLTMMISNGSLPAGTDLYMMIEENGEAELKQFHLESDTSTLKLMEYDGMEETLLDAGISRIQLVIDFTNAQQFDTSKTLYISLADVENQLILSNTAVVFVDSIECMSISQYLDNGSGVAGKNVLAYEGGNLTLHLMKKNHSADLYDHLVVAFYTDAECTTPAILPTQVAVNEKAEIYENLIVLGNDKTQNNICVLISGLAGRNGLTAGQTYYVRTYVEKEKPQEFLPVRQKMITSDIVSFRVEEPSEYQMLLQNLEESLVINPGESLPTCDILYEVRSHGKNENFRIVASLSAVSTQNGEMKVVKCKDNMISNQYGFTTMLGTTSGSFEKVKLVVPADLTSGMYQISFAMKNVDNDAILTEQLYYFVVQ